MPALHYLAAWDAKGANGGSRKALPRFLNRRLFPSLQALGRAALDRFCPVGYEDETGFHYGRPAAKVVCLAPVSGFDIFLAMRAGNVQSSRDETTQD
jgi:hypothetical protein